MSLPPPAMPQPLIVRPDAREQARQAPVLERLVRGGAYRRQVPHASALAPVGEVLAVASVPVALSAVLLTRSGQVAPLAGVVILIGAVVLAAAALGLGVVAGIEIWRRGALGIPRLLRTAFLSALVLALPAWLAVKAFTLPVLNEVSTDPNDPPVFSTEARTLAARGGYRPGEASRAQRNAQRLAWPDLKPLNLDMEPEEAFSSVAEAVKALKWQVTEEWRPDDHRGRGRLEAVVYSPLMRLPQDVTIRFRRVGAVTRVDIRARSRFGRHDFGDNAALVRRLLREMTAPAE